MNKFNKAQHLHKSHLLETKLHMAEKHVLPVVKLALSPRMQHLEHESHCYLVTHSPIHWQKLKNKTRKVLPVCAWRKIVETKLMSFCQFDIVLKLIIKKV